MRTVLEVVLGVVAILFVVTVGYELVTGLPITGGVQAKMKRVGSETLEQVRSDPEGMFIQAKDENLPAFLAFVDLDTAVTDNAVAEYKQIMERIEQYFKGDTRKDIVEAVFTIRSASTYYPDLTCLQSLRYLNDCIPPDFDPKAPSDAPAAHVRQVGDEINQMLVLKYYEPQIEAMKQQQAQQEAAQTAQNEYQARLNETINQNLEKARAYGAARNAQRAAAAPKPMYGEQFDYRYQNMNWAWQNYRNRYAYRR